MKELSTPLNLIAGMDQMLAIGKAFLTSWNGLGSADRPYPPRSTVLSFQRYAIPTRGRNRPLPELAPVSNGTPLNPPVTTLPVSGSNRLMPVWSFLGTPNSSQRKPYVSVTLRPICQWSRAYSAYCFHQTEFGLRSWSTLPACAGRPSRKSAQLWKSWLSAMLAALPCSRVAVPLKPKE